jgi:5-methylcytosine-specific restriction endonuclease McrA
MINDTEWRARYEARINSPEWKALKYNLIMQRGSRCEKCEVNTTFLEMHHKNYDRLGRELPSDLQLLCSNCHVIADRERAIIGRQRAAYTRYYNAYDTYMSKKYGNNYYDSDDTREEFDEWLDRKESGY